MRRYLEESRGDFSEIRDDYRWFRHSCRGSTDRGMIKEDREREREERIVSNPIKEPMHALLLTDSCIKVDS